MKVLLVAGGSRGDTQPIVALARALSVAGHAVVLCVPDSSESLARSYGLYCVSFADFTKKLMEDPEVGSITEGNGLNARARKVSRKYLYLQEDLYNKMATLLDEGIDLMVHHPDSRSHQLAELLGVRSVVVTLGPHLIPTRYVPHPLASLSLPPVLNSASHHWYRVRGSLISPRGLLRSFSRDPVGKWRRDILGLPLRSKYQNSIKDPLGSPKTVLQGFSRHVISPLLKYEYHVHTTGYWYLPASSHWKAPQQLTDFIAYAERPVFVGFGSIVGSNPQRISRIVAEALRLVRVRAVVVTGWGGIDQEAINGDNVFVADQVPYDWLFPQMAAVVHSGGAGTTAAALASGRPQVVCPLFVDQPFWAQRMYLNGVAAAPQPQRWLTPEGLASAIRRAVTDQAMEEQARVLGEHVRAEDGVSKAVKILESLGKE